MLFEINIMILLRYSDIFPKKDKAEIRNQQEKKKKCSGEAVSKTKIVHKNFKTSP